MFETNKKSANTFKTEYCTFIVDQKEDRDRRLDVYYEDGEIVFTTLHKFTKEQIEFILDKLSNAFILGNKEGEESLKQKIKSLIGIKLIFL